MAIEKPSSSAALGATLRGEKMGLTGTDFFIKYHEGGIAFGSPLHESTGDGDGGLAQFENNGILYGDFNFRGAMISSQALGLANIVDPEKNPCSLIIFLGGTRKLSITAKIERIAVQKSERGPWVGVSISGKGHNTTPANIESAAS